MSDFDLNGYFYIEPNINFSISKKSKKIKLTGNFEYEKEYNITIRKGIKNNLGEQLENDLNIILKLEDFKPKIEFTNSGVFLPTTNKSKINFKAINVLNAYVQVMKIHDNNIFYYLQDFDLIGNKTYGQDGGYNFYRIGEEIYSQEINLDKDVNKWKKYELDLEKIFSKDSTGIYFITLSFSEHDILGNYFNNKERWVKQNFFYNSASISKPVIISNIALHAKYAKDKLYIQSIDVLTGKPMPNIKIKTKNYINKQLEEGITDSNGKLILKSSDVFSVEGEYKSQKTFLKLNRDLDMSGFDIEGEGYIDSNGFSAYMYTERGVYRPGDEVNVSLIIRENDKKISDNFPIKYKLYNPNGNLVKEGVNNTGVDGFYNFLLETNNNDITGNWYFVIEAGDAYFSKSISIETVIPNKIRVNIDSDKNIINLKEDNKIDLTISSKYLFGNPASELKYSNTVKIKPYNKTFKNYKTFIFTNEIDESIPHIISEQDGNLNNEGIAKFEINLPKLDKIVSGIKLEINSNVYEKNGRSVNKKVEIPMEYYDKYVGINIPESTYIKIGSDIKLKTVLLTRDGKNISGGKLKYKIYRNNYSWWWDYNSYDDYKKYYKSNWSTEIISEGEIITSNEGGIISHIINTDGEIYVEVYDPVGGHRAGIFLRAFQWGDESNERFGEKLSIKTDKKEYKIGDKAIIIFDSPIGGTSYISIEKNNKILKQLQINTLKAKTSIEIDITEEMFPNAYVGVYMVQAHENGKTDIPLRQYGYVPINIVDNNRIIEFDIISPKEIIPNEQFSIELKTKNNIKTQYTIAIVDEGLLNITNFISPNPYKYFYQNQRLDVQNFDMYSSVIDMNFDEVTKTYIIGGGEAYILDQIENITNSSEERFKSISIFKGPFYTDETGYAKIDFTVPNYIGSIRAMVVMAKDNMYGSNNKDIIVKTPLMILPYTTRKLSPKDKVEIPVTIFATEDNLGKCTVKIDTTGPVKVINDVIHEINLTEKGEYNLSYNLSIDEEIGDIDIKLIATTDKYNSTETINIPVVHSNKYSYINNNYVKAKDDILKIDIIKNGIDSTNKTKYTISKNKKFAIENRLKSLMEYPYGSSESITSNMFSQLYYDGLVYLDSVEQSKKDKNINLGIEKIRKFQKIDGSFGYWNSNKNTNQWVTTYIGHFFIEAKKKGYYIPDSVYKSWLNYEKSIAIKDTEKNHTNLYRLYVLSLAGEPVFSSMNYMRQTYLNNMDNLEKFLLAASYSLANEHDIIKDILENATFSTEINIANQNTYGTDFRDKSIILDTLSYIDPKAYKLDKNELIDYIGKSIESNSWFSTQEITFAIISLAKHIDNRDKDDNFTGEIIVNGTENIQFKSKNGVYTYETDKLEGNIVISSDNMLYVKSEWEGIPLIDENTEKKSLFMNLDITWYDENGKNVNPAKQEKSKTLWAVYTIKKDINLNLEELALVQNIPSGWEIENRRITNDEYPEWLTKKHVLFNNENHVEIRDDKIMVFFNMYSGLKEYSYAIKYNTINKGKYYLPGATVESIYNGDISVTKKGQYVEVN
ncbi:MAG: hypothetical protein GX287_02725 [Fusobacteria bacterium]|nr:hypothetical protein [Fusobacteriota bacterium]